MESLFRVVEDEVAAEEVRRLAAAAAAGDSSSSSSSSSSSALSLSHFDEDVERARTMSRAQRRWERRRHRPDTKTILRAQKEMETLLRRCGADGKARRGSAAHELRNIIVTRHPRCAPCVRRAEACTTTWITRTARGGEARDAGHAGRGYVVFGSGKNI